MNRVLFIPILLGLCVAAGQTQTVTASRVAPTDELSPFRNPDSGSRKVGAFLFDLDMETLTGDVRLLGVESDATSWYLTGARNYTGSYFYQVDYHATSVLNMVSTGHSGWGWRDLGYDGTYLYGSDSFNVEQIDPATGVATGVVIPGPISPCRAVAYDSATDTFWTASLTSSIYQFDRTGVVWKIFTNPGLLIYGAAMDETNNTLWWWSQDGSGTLASAMNPATGAFTGASWDGGSNIWPGIAGGACIYDDMTYGLVLAGMHQTMPDNVAVYSLLSNPPPTVDISCNGGNAGIGVAQGTNAKIDFSITAGSAAGLTVDIWIVMNTPFGFFSYDGAGIYSGWNLGLNNVYFQGPLANSTGTALNRPLPLGSYKAFIGVDAIMNGVLNPANIITRDSVDFAVRIGHFIKGLAPDWNQPLDYPDTFDATGPFPGDTFWNAWCAPTSAAMLIGHWEDEKGSVGLADGSPDGNQFIPNGYGGTPWGSGPEWHDYTADGSQTGPGGNPLRGSRAVEDLGWYMDTNGQGIGGTSHPGTYYYDVAPGLNLFFAARQSPLTSTTLYNTPSFLANVLKSELQNNRTAIAHFQHWGVLLSGPPAGPGTGQEEDEYDFAAEEYTFGTNPGSGGHGEVWDLQDRGHAVLVVGYTTDPAGTTVTHLFVHDNWPGTGRSVKIPVGPELVAVTVVL